MRFDPKQAGVEGKTVDVQESPVSGGKHADVSLKPLAKPYGPYTHWFTDEATGDPALVSLHTANDNLAELPADLCKYLTRALKAGRYAVAVFPIEDGRLFCEWQTVDFPKDDIPKAIELLKNDMQAKHQDAPAGNPNMVDMSKLPPEIRQMLMAAQAQAGGQPQQAAPFQQPAPVPAGHRGTVDAGPASTEERETPPEA